MKILRRAGAACAGVSAVALALGMALPAQAAATPGWRQVLSRHYGPAADYSAYGAVVAPSKNSAWVLGAEDVSGGNGTNQRSVAERWNGTKWGGVSLPAGVTGGIYAASAVSATDIWAVTFDNGYVLHWNGARWSVAKHLPAGFAELTGVTALSATNVWVFGGPGGQPGFGTWHFNGKTWQLQKGDAAGLENASALSASNIWAIGSASAPYDRVQHFNGKNWQTVSAKAFSGLQFERVLAFSAKNIWISAVSQGGTSPGWLVHFNGTQWSRFKVPWAVQPGGVVPDSRGGLWLTGYAIGSSSSYVIHRTASGAWSRSAVAFGLSGLALIPGTRSLWAVGDKMRTTGGDAVIWAYGAIP
jgi:hypothetical protein